MGYCKNISASTVEFILSRFHTVRRLSTPPAAPPARIDCHGETWFLLTLSESFLVLLYCFFLNFVKIKTICPPCPKMALGENLWPSQKPAQSVLSDSTVCISELRVPKIAGKFFIFLSPRLLLYSSPTGTLRSVGVLHAGELGPTEHESPMNYRYSAE